MKILGWIRYGDKASCGGMVIEASSTEISFGKGLTYVGARLACRKKCVVAEANPFVTLSNGRNIPHHGHVSSGGCPLVSTLNNIEGWGNDGGEDIPCNFIQNPDQSWRGVFSLREHEDCEYDQHLILKDQDGMPLEGVLYRITDERGAILEGKTCAEGKTKAIAGNEGSTLSFVIAGENE